MSRQLGDERARYRRKSLREQLDDLLAWPAAHRIATAVIIGFAGVGLLLAATRGAPVTPEDLAVGDCLFIRTDSSQSNDRPIGTVDEVTAAVLAGGAERASCSASHGHEVSAIVFPVVPTRAPDDNSLGTLLDRAAVQRITQPACEAAFSNYVGRSLAGSAYTTSAVFPEPSEWVASGQRTICLVARRDGNWMDHPARGSGE